MVAVTGGRVVGAAGPGGVTFLGLPFAAPPLAERRWRRPAPVIPWRGLRDATRQRPSCPQNDEGWNRADALRGDEDCLTLDIHTPGLTGRRPVMVWIHGGSNRAGSGAGVVRSALARRGVVLVSIQYRLGVLGFLSHRGLAAEQGGHSGNYGLMDQIAALRWVRTNIARFGGNPAQVTLFGESAGAQDVALLLAAPAARHLFRAAVLQSGTPGFGMPFRPLSEALALGDQLDRLSGSGGDPRRLRELPVDRMLALQRQLGEPATRGNEFLFLRTTIDGAILPAPPDRLLAGRPRLPVMIGTNRVEFGPGPGTVDPGPFARFWLGPDADRLLAAYRDELAAGREPRRGPLELRLQSDAQFHCPANRLARRLAGLGWPVWRYEFDQPVSPPGLTAHAHELPYLFEGREVGGGVRLQDYWVALARWGDPNGGADGADRPTWPRVDEGKPVTLRFDPDATRPGPGLPRDSYCTAMIRY
ncbi:carboxylesterase family protein [Novosphingobium sp.]|uniref:carboxylesterase/lipase family protein n=1 Tax=Novosphingobium sp. TaxID=1874826 RepID=UPI00260C8E9A|nr:carboxylesterase family protein [Novosphingobium sp.]